MSELTSDQIPEFQRDKKADGTPYRSMKGPMLAAFLHSITLKDPAVPVTPEFRSIFAVTKRDGVNMTNAMDRMDEFITMLSPAEVETMEKMKLLYSSFLNFGTLGAEASWDDNSRMRYSQLRQIAKVNFPAND